MKTINIYNAKNISYANFVKLEKEHQLYKIDVFVCNFYMSYNRLNELPFSKEYRSKEIYGTLDLGQNKLTSLENIPCKIKRLFVNDNKLTSLENIPYVEEDLSISKNQISNLENIEHLELNNFYCNNNKLSNLKGCPSKIYEFINVSNNELTSLKGIPKNVDTVYCKYNKLKSLEHVGKTKIRFNTSDTPFIEKHLINQANFVETSYTNYWPDYINYCIKNSIDISSEYIPKKYINENLKKSISNSSKFNI